MENSFSLKGNSVLVTGASSGIGRAVAIECARYGANVIITGRNCQRLEETSAEIEAVGTTPLVLAGDLTNPEFRDQINSKIPEIQGLALCQGQVSACPIPFANESKLQNLLNINFISNTELIRLLLKSKKIRRGASVSVLTSVLGIDGVIPGNAIYGASKAALESWIKYCALEYAPKGIRFNTIHPGSIMTPMINLSWATEEQMEIEKNKIPLRRFGEPKEIALAVVFILSQASSFMTGSSIIIDGGQHLSF